MAVAETDQQRIWFAREVFQLFVKCFTNLKLYPHDHKFCVEASGNFSSRLRSYVNMHDVLRIVVGQDALTVNGEPVYEEENRNENLAFRLYVDGLRELSIKKGVTDEEARKLAHIFYQAIVETGADSTVLLWEGDFRHVDFAAINSLSEAWDQPDYMSSDSLDLLKDMNDSVDQIVDMLTSGASDRSAYEFELTDGGAEMDDLEELSESLAERDVERDDEDIYDVPESALESFRAEIGAWGPDRLLQSTVEASLDGLMLQPDLIGRENVAWLLRDALEMALRTSDLELLGTLLGRYDGEVQLAEEEEDEELLRGVIGWLGQEENLDRLVSLAMSRQAVGGPQAFCRVLGYLGDAGLGAAVATYTRAKDKELKDALMGFLGDNLSHGPQALLPLLDPEADADTVKSGLFLLGKQRDLDGQTLGELLNRARQHSDAKIRDYATHLWRTMTEEGRIETAVDALDAESDRDRVKALETLVKENVRDAVPKLKEVISSSAFLQRSAYERRQFIEGFRLLGGQAAIAFLQQQSKRSTGLFNRKAAKETREMATEALQQLRRRR